MEEGQVYFLLYFPSKQISYLPFQGCDSLLGGFMVAGLGVLVQYWLDSGLDPSPEIFHHYGFQALGAGVTFSIVFRTQLAWNRYWEALGEG